MCILDASALVYLESEADAEYWIEARWGTEAHSKLKWFAELLRAESDRQNLVARNSLSSLWLRHFADSAQLIDHVPRETSLWLDLGSGAGFPGIVVAILEPARRVKLIESRRLRMQWLIDLQAALSLANCEIFHGDVKKATNEPAGVISARAFAPLASLIDVAARFSTTNTQWVLPKGRSAEQELQQLPLEDRAMFHVKPSITDREAGIIVGTGQVTAK